MDYYSNGVMYALHEKLGSIAERIVLPALTGAFTGGALGATAEAALGTPGDIRLALGIPPETHYLRNILLGAGIGAGLGPIAHNLIRKALRVQ